MPCLTLGNAIICGPPQGIVRRAVLECPTCKRRRRFVVMWQGMWYGEDQQCLGCGDRFCFTEGHRYPLDQRRGARAEAKAEAADRWRNAMTPAEYRRATEAEVRAYFEDEVTA